MKILMICFNIIEKGSYLRAFNLAKYLVRRGHQVSIMATSPFNRFSIHVSHEQGVQIIQTPDLLVGSMRSGWDLYNIFRRIAWLETQQFDIIHGFETRPTVLLPILWSKQRNKNINIFFDWADWLGIGGAVEEREPSFARSLIRCMDTYFEENFRQLPIGTTVICETLLKRALEKKVSPSRLCLLPNGCNTQTYFPIDIVQAREACNLPLNIPIIGHVGTIFARDAILLRESFEQLRLEVPNARLLVIGYAPQKILKKFLQGEGIIVTGYISSQEQLNLYLNSCDLFWLPLNDSLANKGRLPLKLMDYMSVGRPIISTRVGDIVSYFEHDEIGVLCPPDPMSFSCATQQLISDPHRLRRIGEVARSLSLTTYSWEKVGNKLEGFYTSIMK